MDSKEQKAVFLDRDGTINVEKDYLINPRELAFVPGAPHAIRALNRAGYLVVVVTNQSGIARGYFSVSQVNRLHNHMQNLLQQYGAFIDAFYICPHHPTAGNGPYTGTCKCRKGEPGMLLAAAQDMHIDLASSYMVGDKIADLEAGFGAGCRPLLVRSGYGNETGREPAVQTWLETGHITLRDDLRAAAEYILAQDG